MKRILSLCLVVLLALNTTTGFAKADWTDARCAEVKQRIANYKSKVAELDIEIQEKIDASERANAELERLKAKLGLMDLLLPDHEMTWKIRTKENQIDRINIELNLLEDMKTLAEDYIVYHEDNIIQHCEETGDAEDVEPEFVEEESAEYNMEEESADYNMEEVI